MTLLVHRAEDPFLSRTLMHPHVSTTAFSACENPEKRPG
jgi:hypothetical protein